MKKEEIGKIEEDIKKLYFKLHLVSNECENGLETADSKEGVRILVKELESEVNKVLGDIEKLKNEKN